MSRGPQAGFTLLELLVGMALLALISVLLIGSLNLAIRSQDAVRAAAEREEERRLVLSFLRRQIEAAQPVAFPTGSRLQVAFSGDAARLDFAAEMRGRDGATGLWLVRLAVEAGAGGSKLVLLRRPLAAGPAAFAFGADAERGVLLADATGVGFAFADAEGWQDEWREREELPRLVRVSLGGGDWPDLLVAPRMGRPER